ncbi:hypothetical protein YPPY01_0494, partial [Yersinia pestis PY-01]
MLAGRT